MQCVYYYGDACKCPARRRTWRNLERWLLGPHPLCIFDEIEMWWDIDIQSHGLAQAAPMLCRHLIPMKVEPVMPK
jgi:hypothetical protein